jgi:hypothetical protein
MKVPCVMVVMATALAVAGCGKGDGSSAGATNKPAATNESGGSLVTAPVDYLGAISQARHSAVKTIDVTSVNKAISLFQVDKGRNPASLDELVREKYLAKIPEPPYGSKLVYDAVKGEAKVVQQ